MRQVPYKFSFLLVFYFHRADIAIRKFIMEEAPPPCGKKRNSLSRDDEGPALPVNKRMQSSLVITGPDGKIMTKDGQREALGPWSARSKFDTARVKQQLVRSRTCDLDMKLNSSRNVAPSTPSHPIKRQTGFSTPQPFGKSGLSKTSLNPLMTPWRLPKTPHGSDYANTPTTQTSKIRPPMSSSRKLRSKAVAKLRMLDDQELQASRLEQARQDLLMERQERAYIAWLNHVLDRPATGGSRLSNFEDFVSRNSSVTPPSFISNSAYSGFKLIDEVYWDEDCVTSSPRDPTYLGRSPRNPLVPLNGVGNRGFGSPGVTDMNNFKRSLKDVFSTPDRKAFVGQSPATPHLSSKRLKMITEHGFCYPRDAHMQDVCRLSELARRLKLHFSQTEREEILAVITQLAKHIDEGRLRMKKGCTLLTDVALRKKALHVLLNYSAYWMRIGLHVVLGHTALLKERLNEDDSKQMGTNCAQDAEFALLEVFLERHFLAHPGLAKRFATNKAIEGLYRDGYSEALGRVILKRFFLLVLVLDKAKCQTTLKITDGIDGVDGGSPALFRSDARVKSSRQALQEFLSDVMHGEGDVVGNLSALGYHVHHCQVPLADYDFAVVDLIEDLQDGVRLCRLVQLLAANDTFFLEHIQVPSNGRKRRLHNCQIALESLAQAGVPLEDEDGCCINAEDIVAGNRDKVFPLLWNIMVHLQIPLLVSRPRLCQEIAKLQGTEGGVALGLNIGTVELLLKWTQVACMITGNLNVRNFKTSFADGQALCFIVNLYLPALLPQNALLRPTSLANFEEHAGMQVVNTIDVKVAFSSAHKKVVAHNFGLVQDVARKLGSIPEVLQLVDLLGDPGMSERNIIIFVAFLCSRLLQEKPLDLSMIQRGMIAQDSDANHQLNQHLRYSSQCNLESESPNGFSRSYSVPWPQHEALCGALQPQVYSHSLMHEAAPRIPSDETLDKICKIQGWWRALLSRRHTVVRRRTSSQEIQTQWRKFSSHLRRRHDYALKIQAHWRGYVARQLIKCWNAAATKIQAQYRAHVHSSQAREQAAHVLQYYFRAWARKRRYLATVSDMCKIQALWWAHEARGNFLRERKAVCKIETEWLNYVVRRRFHIAQAQWRMSQSAQFIQAHWRGYYTRQILMGESTTSKFIQSWIHDHIQRRDYLLQEQRIDNQNWIQNGSIQGTSTYLARIQRQEFDEEQAAKKIQTSWRYFKAHRKMQLSAIAIQAMMTIKARKSIRIQAYWRGHVGRQKFKVLKQAARKIQSRWRQFIARRRRQLFVTALQATFAVQSRRSTKIQACWRGHVARQRFEMHKRAAQKIQSEWRQFISHRKWQVFLAGQAALIVQTTGSIRIQACWRGHVTRQRFEMQKQAAQKIQREWRHIIARWCKRNVSAIAIQARWRGYRTRKVLLERAEAASLIQRYYLGHLQRRSFTSCREIAIFIQAHYRAFVQRRLFKITQVSICRIQSAWRAHTVRRQFLEKRRGAQIIQSLWRHHRVRRKHDSATRLRAAWLSYKSKREHQRQRVAAIILQSFFRAHIQRRQFQKYRVAACIVQAQFKGCVQRKAFQATVSKICKIQAMGRANTVRAQYRRTKSAVETIQWTWRQFSIRKRLNAAIHIQSVWRAYSLRKLILHWGAASTLIQKQYRRYVHRRDFRMYYNAVVRCQALWKGKLMRRRIQGWKEGATRIQAALRGMLQRRRLREQRKAASRIQSVFRAWQVHRVVIQDKQALLLRIRSAMLIQTTWKKHFQLKVEAHCYCKTSVADASTDAQRASEHENVGSRADLESQEGAVVAEHPIKEETICSADIFQAGYQDAIFTRSSAAVIIQKYVRRRSAKKLLQQLAEDLLSRRTVQTLPESAGPFFQAFSTEACDYSISNSQAQLLAALLIQSRWRGHLVRKNIWLEKENILRLSNSIRCHSVHNSSGPKFSPRELKAASVILDGLRTFVQRANYVKLRRCIIVVQRHVRGWIHRSSFAQMKDSVILVQAHWRGYSVRRRQSHAKDPLGELRQRIQSTASTIQDSERLCNRLTEALSLLLSQKTVSGILSTCRTIDVATQHSKHCCERLAEVGAITTILHLIQTINRSPPLEQVLKHALSSLNNLARYPPLATRIAQSPSAISIISEQLHTFRNNEEIFAQAISVLQIVCKTSVGIAVLQRERPVFRRLQLIAQSLERKVQVEKRNLEKLPWATAATMQRKSAQKKMSEANCQFLSTMALMKDINRLSHYQTASICTKSTSRKHSASTPTPKLTRSVGAKSVAAKRVSTPCYHQRPPLATRSSRRVTDLPCHGRSNLF